jgi:hypothetical protein
LPTEARSNLVDAGLTIKETTPTELAEGRGVPEQDGWGVCRIEG